MITLLSPFMLCLCAGIEIASHSPILSSRENVGDIAVNGDGQPGPMMRAERLSSSAVPVSAKAKAQKQPDGRTPAVDAAASAVQMLASGAMRIVGETVPPSPLNAGARRIFDESQASPPLREIELVSPEPAPAARAPAHPLRKKKPSPQRFGQQPTSFPGPLVRTSGQNSTPLVRTSGNLTAASRANATAHSSYRSSVASAASDKDEGFQEKADAWQDEDGIADVGYKWKDKHNSRAEAADDDWNEDSDKDPDDDSASSSTPDTTDDNSTEGAGIVDGSDGDLDGDGTYDGDDGSPMVNVTAEEDATAPANAGVLQASNPEATLNPKAVAQDNEMEKLGEGIGAMAYDRSPTGNRNFDQELRQRLQLQDVATIALLICVFFLTVILSCCSVYQVAHDPSPAAYYSEPKNYQQRIICESHEVDSFLAAFNTQPQNVCLRIVGRNPEPGGFRRFLRTLNAHSARSRGLAAVLPMRQRRRLHVLFDVCLDLTPFITGDGRLSDDNLVILQNYLGSKNHLERVLLQKKVDWPVWEDIATNIRQRLRSLGFPGDVEVRFEAEDEVLVYQNHKWSNFVRNRVTQALVMISIVGSAVWIPYVWARSKTTKVETRFRINVDPARYWELVCDQLSAADGFHT